MDVDECCTCAERLSNRCMLSWPCLRLAVRLLYSGQSSCRHCACSLCSLLHCDTDTFMHAHAWLCRAAVDEAIASGVALEEDGVEEAFELIAEVPERVRTVSDGAHDSSQDMSFPICMHLQHAVVLSVCMCRNAVAQHNRVACHAEDTQGVVSAVQLRHHCAALPCCSVHTQSLSVFDTRCAVCCEQGLWVGDCFIYNNAAWRLNYCVGGEVTTMCHLDRPMYLLGYLAAQSRVYLMDRWGLYPRRAFVQGASIVAAQPVVCPSAAWSLLGLHKVCCCICNCICT